MRGRQDGVASDRSQTDAEVTLDAFRWVTSAETYDRALVAGLANGVVPILQPDAPRAARWSKVLEAYGLRRAQHAPAPVSAPPIGEGLVAAFGPRFEAIAKRYAEATARAFVAVHAVEDLTAIAADHTSTLLVVDPDVGALDHVGALHTMLASPWGVLSARDEAALTFLLAKQNAGPLRTGDRALGIVDTTWRSATMLDGGGDDVSIVPLTADLTRAWITDRAWSALGIVAHGEGSHLNLDVVVCCGAPDGGERRRDGSPVDGCRFDANGALVCKRVQDRNKHPLRFGDIRAELIGLFSCIGWSTAQQVFPSNNSLLLDGVEGFMAASLTTDRIVPIPVWLPLLAMALLRQGCPAGELVELVNDVMMRHHGCRTFLLFGDPRAPSARAAPDAPNAVTVHTIDGSDHEVFRPEGAAVRLAGHRRLLTFSTGGALPVPPLATHEHRRLGVALRRAAHRALGIAAIEGSLARSIPNELDALAAERIAVVAAIDDAFHHWEHVRVSGVWTSVLDERVEALTSAIEGWDAVMAALAAEHLFDRVVEEVLATGRHTVELVHEGTCPRCASRLRLERRAAAWSEAPVQVRIDCPLCGGRETYLEGSWRIETNGPEVMVRGASHPVMIRATAPPDGVALATSGWLVGKLTDRGDARTIAHVVQPFDASAAIDFDIPVDITMELHIRKFLLVQDLGIAYLRERLPALPPGAGVT